MAAPVLRFYNATNASYLNLNDLSTYFLVAANVGSKVKTFDEYRSYSGSVAQYNVTTANLIDMTFEIEVKSTTAALLRTALAAINTKIDDIAAGTTHLLYETTTYHLMSSPNIDWEEDWRFLTGFTTTVILTLKRNTDVA